MVATDKVFAGSIPETYERFLVPIIFQSYAIDLAERVVKPSPKFCWKPLRELEF